MNLRIQVKAGFDPQTRQSLWEPYFPPSAGGLLQHPQGEGVLNDILAGLLQAAGLARAREDEPIQENKWGDVFIRNRWLPYTVLFIKDAFTEDIPTLLFRARNFFHASQKISASEEDLSLKNPSLLHYAKLAWFFFSLEGGGFMCFNAQEDHDFFKNALPDHLVKQYYLIFLLTLQQRFALMMLLDEVVTNYPASGSQDVSVAGALEKEEFFERTHQKLVTFTARGYFSQAMQHPNHHRCYTKWQETFQIEKLYQEVSDEVRFLSDCLHTQRERQRRDAEELRRQREEVLEKIVRLFTTVIGVPAIVLSYFDAIGPVAWWVALLGVIAGIIVGSLLYYALGEYSKRARHTKV